MTGRSWLLSDKVIGCPGRAGWLLSGEEETKRSDLPLVGFRRTAAKRSAASAIATRKLLPLPP